LISDSSDDGFVFRSGLSSFGESIAACGLKLLALFHRLAMGGGMGHVPFMNDLIVIDPAICNGRPVVKGTRITVQSVMEFLAAGDSVDEVLEAYPSLKREQVLACMEWASRLMGNHFQIAELA
jgi:uncharacterized protein (DUF433 family)